MYLLFFNSCIIISEYMYLLFLTIKLLLYFYLLLLFQDMSILLWLYPFYELICNPKELKLSSRKQYK